VGRGGPTAEGCGEDAAAVRRLAWPVSAIVRHGSRKAAAAAYLREPCLFTPRRVEGTHWTIGNARGGNLRIARLPLPGRTMRYTHHLALVISPLLSAAGSRRPGRVRRRGGGGSHSPDPRPGAQVPRGAAPLRWYADRAAIGRPRRSWRPGCREAAAEACREGAAALRGARTASEGGPGHALYRWPQ
jgi:hypothetical protein